MSIKSTEHLTRSQAETLYHNVKAEIKALKGGIKKVSFMSDSDLGDKLDDLTDELCDLQGVPNFANYIVD